jgi:hypothetical protein
MKNTADVTGGKPIAVVLQYISGVSAIIPLVAFYDVFRGKREAVVTGGKPMAVVLQSISLVSAINPLVAFYDIHGGKTEVLFFYFVPGTTRDY